MGRSEGEAGLGRDDEEFSAYCSAVLSSLRRAEQRRWAETYLSGLLDGDGRKSIRRMVGSEDRRRQALQQFLNQSPWDDREIRRIHADLIANALQPIAWAIDEVPFVKYGSHSVAVERQYVRRLGRVSNCQLGLAVSLVGPTQAVPVNWRLVLPPSWDRDAERRRRAHLPPHERHRPHWQYLVEALDELEAEWAVPSAPVIAEALDAPTASSLLAALEERRLGYLVEVGGDLPVSPNRPLVASAPPPGPARTVPETTPLPIREIASLASERSRTISWTEPRRTVGRAQFTTAAVAIGLPAEGDQPGPGTTRRIRLLIAELPVGEREPRAYWLTNLFDRRLPSLVSLMKARLRTAEALDQMRDAFGLLDFEGRSYRGWHHHVTLASAAYGYSVLRRTAGGAT